MNCELTIGVKLAAKLCSCAVEVTYDLETEKVFIMANRKRYQKQPNNTQPFSYQVGDSVVVKPGVNSPEYGGDISGWQGRITELLTDQEDVPTVMIAWDSQTLRKIPESFIKECEREGLGWESMGVFAHEVELTKPRDTLASVERTFDDISAQYQWAHLGEEGDRIQQVMNGVSKKSEMAAFKAWKKYLAEILEFPFDAEVSEWQDRGPLQVGDQVTLLGFESIEDSYGILVKIESRRGEFVFPLCDLKALDRDSPYDQPLNDYDVWFANR